MSTLTIRLPDDQHERLKTLAAQRGFSLNKLFEEFSTKAIAEFDTENRFRLRAARGDKARGLEILAGVERKFAGRRGEASLKYGEHASRIVIPELRSNIRDPFRRRAQLFTRFHSWPFRNGSRLASLRSLAGMTCVRGAHM